MNQESRLEESNDEIRFLGCKNCKKYENRFIQSNFEPVDRFQQMTSHFTWEHDRFSSPPRYQSMKLNLRNKKRQKCKKDFVEQFESVER